MKDPVTTSTISVKGVKFHRARWKDVQGKWRDKRFRKKADLTTYLDSPEFQATIKVRENKIETTYQEAAEKLFGLLETGLDGKPPREKRTIKGYRQKQATHVYPEFGDHVLATMTRSDVQDMMKSILRSCNSRRTAKHTFTTCKQILRWAKTEGYMFDSIDEGLSITMPSREVKEIEIWTEQEMDRVKAVVRGFVASNNQRIQIPWRDRYNPLFLILLGLGLRISEAFGLQWHDFSAGFSHVSIRRRIDLTASIDDEEERIGSPKTRRSNREIVVPQYLKSELEALKERVNPMPDDFVIMSREGGSVHYTTIRNFMWSKMVEKAKVRDLGLHSVRHYYASVLIANKVDPLSISRMMGHHSVGFTMDTYGHLFRRRDGEEEIAKALEESF